MIHVSRLPSSMAALHDTHLDKADYMGFLAQKKNF